MALVDHHTFTMVPRHTSEEHEQFGSSMYPDPPHGAFSSAGVDMGLSSDAFDPRFLPVSMGAYNQTPFAVDGFPTWTYDNGEMRAHLSPASETSPSSSAAGSPRSTHDQPAPIPDWAPHGVMSPNIVDSQAYYAASTEYSFAPGSMDDLSSFTFAETSKPPGFVGKLPQTSTISASEQQPQHHGLGPMSPCVSRRDSTCSLFSEAGPALASPSEPAHGQNMSSPISPSSSRSFSVFAPSDPSMSLSSPTAPLWTSPTARHVSPFFSQSSGHFIAPLGSSCWFSFERIL